MPVPCAIVFSTLLMINIKLKPKNLLIYFTVILVAALILVFLYHENNDIIVSKYSIYDDSIPNGFDGFKIVQISDLHNKQFGEGQQKLLEQIERQQPDIIVLTGDMVDDAHIFTNGAEQLVEKLCDIAPTYSVSGNNDYFSASYDGLLESMNDAGIVDLNDASIRIERNGDYVTLVGMDNRLRSFTNLITRMQPMEEQYTILLAHRPEFLWLYSEAGADMVLSGHAHGGQIGIPKNGMFAPGQGFFPKLTRGVHEYETTTMVISRGLGNSVAPQRLFNKPELVVIELETEG